ncbi:MAG: DUF1778 domain-containing protein [Deltaproteobacteria bacterium]|nr:DUF1778 domain-containing protein [Deltaproteobacteria bacterium]
MARARAVKSERLDVRLSPDHKELIEDAAALAGQPTSAFAVSTLVERARQIVSDRETTVLSARDKRRFLEILDEQKPSERLRRAAQRFKAHRA